MTSLTEGQIAPDFELPDSMGKMHRLSSFRDKVVVLYFYPKDDTPGCTKQACDLRDNFHLLSKKGVVIIGISIDSITSHAGFSKKYALPFLLLSDSKKEVAEKYGVLKSVLGFKIPITSRTTFIIDKDGKIKKIFENVDPNTHATQILDLVLMRT